MTLQANGTTVINLDRSFILGTATPGSPATGLIRWNSSLSQFEVYNGTAWVNVIAGSTASPLWSWGRSYFGELGDNTTVSKSSPVSVVGGFTDWTQISGGSNNTGALRANGTAWKWGINLGLGDNTGINRSSPVSVVGGFTDWTQISVGSSHTAALRSNGTAWAWGSNNYGQLGTNNTNTFNSPVSVVGGITDWVDISAGESFTIGLRARGTILSWGRNTLGRLGNGGTNNYSSPLNIVGGFTNWTQISASNNHIIALRANGTAWGWGLNSYGQLGDNTITNRSSPVSVVGGFTDWIDISAGDGHTVALRANGTAWAWGRNYAGKLGDDTITSRRSPVSVVGGFTDWAQISAGSNHNLALKTNGTIWAWGSNNKGQLGINTTTSSRSPVSVVGGFTDWVQVAAGADRSMALRAV